MKTEILNKNLMIRPGYACIDLKTKKNYRVFRLKTIQDQDIEKIREIVHHNLILLGDTIYKNIKDNIFVYRITADIIPFMSHPEMKRIIKVHQLLEAPKIKNELARIRKWQEEYQLRLSMHSSHFVILSSPKEDVVEKSINELEAQAAFLDLVNGSNLIIHIGGAYGDKEASLERLKGHIEKYKNRLDLKKLTIENDDKTYNSKDVVEVCQLLGLKWVYDFHHERCNHGNNYSIIELLKEYPPDKYHLSSGVEGAFKPPHADYIYYEDMKAMIEQLESADRKDVDIMLEAKKKNLAIEELLEPVKNGYWNLIKKGEN